MNIEIITQLFAKELKKFSENFFLMICGYIFKTTKKNEYKIICATSFISLQAISNFAFPLKFYIYQD